ncbi:UNVERIFIED_CONTAM: hypothetical protein FOS07_33490, partial [Bacillus mycoides]
ATRARACRRHRPWCAGPGRNSAGRTRSAFALPVRARPPGVRLRRSAPAGRWHGARRGLRPAAWPRRRGSRPAPRCGPPRAPSAARARWA